MRSYINGRQAVTSNDFIELALGTPVELWLGVDGESEMERAARLDAARDILSDDPGMPDDAIRIAAAAIEDHAAELFNVVPMPRPVSRHRSARKEVAA
ncbi:hypothetical protein OG758_26030 [Streptomyces sp. NBC_01474]|uniref:hypothetical protein n=1 Tax=unclassified Streptomyces TaxID=2593676 RepID=UPI002DD97C46|nr:MULTISPECIES: hypothetical protein [unclassified Streptomyces]WSD97309.1 hypothetical protein OG758_26030 [Streptomyces sp. NBC_01474]